MDIMTALLAFVLSLLGMDAPRSTFVHREDHDGRTVLHARASVEAGVARFDCIESATGLCYWTVQPPDCTRGACSSRRFATAVHDSRQLAGFTRVRLCVAARADAPRRCHALGTQ